MKATYGLSENQFKLTGSGWHLGFSLVQIIYQKNKIKICKSNSGKTENIVSIYL